MVSILRKNKYYCFKECRKGLYYLDISNPETILLINDSGDIDF